MSLSLFLIFPDDSAIIGTFIIILSVTAVLASLIISISDSISKIIEWFKNRKSKIQDSNEATKNMNTTITEITTNEIRNINMPDD